LELAIFTEITFLMLHEMMFRASSLIIYDKMHSTLLLEYLDVHLIFTIFIYDYSSNNVLSRMYDILRIDLRNTVLDTNTGFYTTKGLSTVGYLAGELNKYYNLQELSNGFPITSLRNIGYTAKEIYDIVGSPYTPFDIVTCYNINIDISNILTYQ
jgi:hypothetical protein